MARARNYRLLAYRGREPVGETQEIGKRKELAQQFLGQHPAADHCLVYPVDEPGEPEPYLYRVGDFKSEI